MRTFIAHVEPTVAGRGLGRVRVLLASEATRACWSVFWRSRLLIWTVGCLAVLVFGVKVGVRHTFDPFGVSSSLGSVGNVLGAPAVRWDAIWYLSIAKVGYPFLQTAGFFPLYPLLIHVLSWVTISPAVAGVLISSAAAFVGLVIVFRLCELELGGQAARATVALLAFAPFSFYLSAVYTEGLFLMLSAGTLYCARRGQWAAAGVLGALASLSRVTGVLLLVPVVVLFLYGPRSDALPKPPNSTLAPRYPLSPKLLWSLLIPAGLVSFFVYTALDGLGFSATFDAQRSAWQHHFVAPLSGVWEGVQAAWHQLEALVAGHWTVSERGPETMEIVVLLLCVIALIGVFRRLPLAYGLYALAGLLVPLSSPTVGEPLRGFGRYASMLFPLFMWAGAWICERGRRRRLMYAFAAVLIGLTWQFATWRYVGTVPI